VTEAVLFDFNGVLVDDEAQHCEALQVVLRDERITLSREAYYADYLGLDDRAGFVQAFRRANRTLTTQILDRLVATKSRVYLTLIAKSLRLVAGVAEFVRESARRYRLGIVSGALRREIDIALRKSGLAVVKGDGEQGDRFEVIIAADDVLQCKPDPAAYLAALAAFNKKRPIAASACVAIEDSLPGLEAARAAGMPCVMLTTNHPASTLGGRGAALVWDSFSGHTAAELADL
jgi:beta-phosphoglucomutase-like phosphatase (HAD superfamily)